MDEKSEILAEIKALSSHYPRRQLGMADQARWLSDYAEDLGCLSAADVRLACSVWRRGEKAKMPAPGELLALCRRMMDARPVPMRIAPPDPPPQYSDEHRAKMQTALRALAEEITAKSALRGGYKRRSGESETEYGRRLWPDRERQPRGS